jgi:peptidoglycan/LPS O-acetylase OafA/YrhL
VVVVFYHTSKIVFFGKWAVYVFFILSGYWLDQIYGSNYSQATHPIRTFYISRFLRVYPVFAVATLLAFFAQQLVQGGYHLAWQQWMLLGYSSLPFRLLEPGWSLDIEVQFYIVFPLLFSLFRNGINVKRILPLSILCVGGIVAFGPLNSLVPYCGFFAVGMAVSQYEWKPSSALWNIGLFASLALFVAVFAVPTLRNSVLSTGKLSLFEEDLTPLFDITFAVVTVPFLATNVTVRDTALGRHAGNLSFPLYLVHWVTLGPYVAWYGGLPVRERLVWFVLYLLVTALLTLVVYVTVDRPFENIRRRFINSQCRRRITETPNLAGEV